MAGTHEKSPVKDVEDLAYEVVNKVARGIESLLGKVEPVGAKYEASTVPAYNIVMDGVVNPEKLAEDIASHLKKFKVRQQVDETGGRAAGVPLNKENLLRELYRYVAHNSEEYLDWDQSYEDQYATPKSDFVIENLLRDVGSVLTDK